MEIYGNMTELCCGDRESYISTCPGNYTGGKHMGVDRNTLSLERTKLNANDCTKHTALAPRKLRASYAQAARKLQASTGIINADPPHHPPTREQILLSATSDMACFLPSHRLELPVCSLLCALARSTKQSMMQVANFVLQQTMPPP